MKTESIVLLVVGLIVGALVGPMLFPVSAPEVPPKAGEGITIVFLGESSSADVTWSNIVAVMEDTADIYGVAFSYRFAEGDFAVHVDMIYEEIARAVDAIIASFWDPDMYNDAIMEAIDNGIVVVSAGLAPENMNLPQEYRNKLGYVGWPSPYGYWAGRKLGELGLNYVPDGGKILFPAEVPSGSYILNGVNGLEEYFSENGKTVNVEILDCTSDTSTAQSRIVAYLTANPDVDAVMTTGAICISASILALEQMGVEAGEKPVAIGQVISDVDTRGVRGGLMPAGFRIDFDTQAYYMLTNAFWAVYRGVDPARTDLPIVTVDQSNVDFYFPTGE